MSKRTFCAVLVAVLMLGMALAGCTREYGDTDEYRAFLKIKKLGDSVSRTQTAENYTYTLESGVLYFLDASGTEIWRSDKYWYVDDFRLFDIDGDGDVDCLFSLWKSYSYYRGYAGEDDPSVRQHLFLYTIRNGYAKSLWNSSNLPRPIYSFEFSEGVPTPVSTGAVMRTCEGRYTADYAKSPEQEFTYTWQGWGFVEND